MVGVVMGQCFVLRNVGSRTVKRGSNDCIMQNHCSFFDQFRGLFLQSVVYPQLLCVRFSQSMVHTRCALHLHHGTAGSGSGFSFVGLSALLGPCCVYKFNDCVTFFGGSCTWYACGAQGVTPVSFGGGSDIVAGSVCHSTLVVLCLPPFLLQLPPLSRVV